MSHLRWRSVVFGEDGDDSETVVDGDDLFLSLQSSLSKLYNLPPLPGMDKKPAGAALMKCAEAGVCLQEAFQIMKELYEAGGEKVADV